MLIQQRIGMRLRSIIPSEQHDIVGALRSFQSFGGWEFVFSRPGNANKMPVKLDKTAPTSNQPDFSKMLSSLLPSFSGFCWLLVSFIQGANGNADTLRRRKKVLNNTAAI
jgi:hypothetical protein